MDPASIFVAVAAAVTTIGAAYVLLHRTVDKEMKAQNKSIQDLDARIGDQSQSLGRERVSRLNKDTEHRDARSKLDTRISLLENEFRRWRYGDDKDKST